MIDLLVAGGGPAGLATAVNAALAGLDVVIVEPRPGPVDKACGEGLMPAAARALADLGATADGRPLRGIRYLDADHRVEAAFPTNPGKGVRRTELHRALSRRAADLGIPVVTARVDGLRQDGRSVTAAGITARYLAAADGLHSRIRRELGLGLHPGGRAARYGQRRHFAVPPWTDYVEVHWTARAEAYVTPVGANLVGVSVLTEDRASFETLLAPFRELAARLPVAAATDARGAGPLRQRVRTPVAGRVLLVGDAAGYTDALTGEGLAIAFHAAAELVRCVRQDRPQDYDRAWRGVSRRYRLLTASLLWLRTHQPLGQHIVPVAARFPALFTAAVHRLA
ncbi:NAD(P)/FAD-dependent oxidoreductase [Streptomyces sp. NPDC052051]|uniref:NAD(P)/FAD-dependent oxidoreductase n=1 Tax=Streptomyces sp. NPDC052051 TaxID=3154649 RepID=UPI00343B6C0F